MGNIKSIQRTNNSIIEIKLSFMGATSNFYLLEEVLVNIKKVSIYQYSNYLSLLALCIELGMKSMIIETGDVETIHLIDDLFRMTPLEFQNDFRLLYPDNDKFDLYMSNSKNIFVNLRYYKPDNLRMFLDNDLINLDKTINIQDSFNQVNVKFIHELLDEINKFHRIKWIKCFNNLQFINDNDSLLDQYNELLLKKI